MMAIPIGWMQELPAKEYKKLIIYNFKNYYFDRVSL
jgi:hypothetical protein